MCSSEKKSIAFSKSLNQSIMSDHFVHTYSDCDGSSGQAMQSYHSAWMSHWMRRSYKEIIPNHNCSSSGLMNKESCEVSNQYLLTSGKEMESNIGRGLGEIKSGCSNIRNESTEMTSTTTGLETRKFQFLPIDGPCKKDESASNRKDIQAANAEAMRAHQSNHNPDFDSTKLSLRCYIPPGISMAPDADKTLPKECHFEAEGMSRNTKEHVDACSFFGDRNFAIPRPISKDLNISSTDMVQLGLGRGNEGIPFFPSRMSRPALAPEEQLLLTNPSFAKQECLDSQRHSTLIVCESKAENHSKSGRSFTSYQQQNQTSSPETGPCKINYQLPALGGEQFPETKRASGISIFWNQSNHHSGVARFDNLYNVPSSSCKFPSSLQDLESMRICTTLDSVVPNGAQPMFPQTTHSLLITKRTDLNSCKLNASFRNSREVAQSNGSAFLQLCGMPPLFGSGVKIQSIGSSTNSEGEENVGYPLVKFVDAEAAKAFDSSVEGKGKKVIDYLDQKNESSADTCTMDLDDFKQQNPHLSVNSSPSSKLLKLSLVTPQQPQPTFVSTSLHRQNECKLPAINLELPALPALNDGDACSSRTESLDMETLSKHAEPLSQSHGGSATPEPSSRWIKRLKSGVSVESHGSGTKFSNAGEWSCDEKSSSARKNLKRRGASSEPTVDELHGKELMVLDKTRALVRCGESSSVETAGEKGNHWIRRWSHNQSAMPPKKPAATVVSKPQSSKLAFEEDLPEQKPFPSIAAMALMAKAMRGFQPCDFENKGSVILWNTRGF